MDLARPTQGTRAKQQQQQQMPREYYGYLRVQSNLLTASSLALLFFAADDCAKLLRGRPPNELNRHSRKFMQSIETPEKKEEDCAHSKRSNYVNLYVLQEKRERGVMLASMFFNERDRERERDRFSTFVNIIMCKLPENMSQKTPISSGNLRLGLMVKYRQ